MELAALRLTALRALDLFTSSVNLDEKAKAIKVAVRALEAAVNVLAKEQLLSGDAPILKDLWDAIAEANRIERVDKEI
jgi:hypothetical protein